MSQPLSNTASRVLQLIKENPGCSNNFLYNETRSPKTRANIKKSSSVGTSNWSVPKTLMQMGLVRREARYRKDITWKVSRYFYFLAE